MIRRVYKYRMIRIHIISDLFLEYNEFTPIEDTIIPDVDLVILNGNIGHLKRGMFYAEELASVYPDIEFIYNFGETERFRGAQQKYNTELFDSMKVRVEKNPLWPKNLHWSIDPIHLTLKNGRKVDILCTYGFPKIYSCNVPWEETIWFSEYVMGVTTDHDSFRPKDASIVWHGTHPVWASLAMINEQHTLEHAKIKQWELEPTTFKILVTHINPYKDSRCKDIEYAPPRIHLENGLWIAADTKTQNLKFLGARLESNPGRGSPIRSNVIVID